MVRKRCLPALPLALLILKNNVSAWICIIMSPAWNVNVASGNFEQYFRRRVISFTAMLVVLSCYVTTLFSGHTTSCCLLLGHNESNFYYFFVLCWSFLGNYLVLWSPYFQLNRFVIERGFVGIIYHDKYIWNAMIELH